MKRCPECRRDYYDDSLLYCLDDGTALLEGPASDVHSSESPTAVLPGGIQAQPTTLQKAHTLDLGRRFEFPFKWMAIALLGLGAVLIGVFLLLGDRRPDSAPMSMAI